MWPVVFRIPEWVPILGEQAVTSFGLALLVAFLSGGYVFSARLRRAVAGRAEPVWELVLLAALGGVLGAKLYYELLDAVGLGYPFSTAGARSGLNWWGGLVGGGALVAWRARSLKLPLGAVADAAAPALAIGYAFGRMGSFLAGADYGLPTDGPLGIAFIRGAPPTTVQNMALYYDIVAPLSAVIGNYVRVHPTQLYEAALSLLIFGLLLHREPGREGRVFGLYLLLAGIARVAVELVRAKPDRLTGPVTLDMLVAMGVTAAGMALLLWSARRVRVPAGAAPRDADTG